MSNNYDEIIKLKEEHKNEIEKLCTNFNNKLNEHRKMLEEQKSEKQNYQESYSIVQEKILELESQYKNKEEKLKFQLSNELANKETLNNLIQDIQIENSSYLKEINKISENEDLNKEKIKLMESNILNIAYENLLMKIPLNKEKLELNKKFNGYGIIIDIDSNNDKFIAWTNQTVASKIKFNTKITDLLLDSGKLTITTDANNEIVLDFNYNYKIDYTNVENGIIDLSNLKKKNNMLILEKLQEFCKFKRDTHNEASKIFFNKNLCFVLPSILITALSGILSFLASSSEINADIGVWFSITVGILSSISTFLQSFSGAMDFGGKTEGHTQAREEYDNILTIINFEINNPKESEENPDDFYDKIKKNIIDIKQKCKYQVSDSINKKYNFENITSQVKKIKHELLKDTILLKADMIRNNTEEVNNYEDIDFNKIEKNLDFSSLFNNKNNNVDSIV